MSAATDRLTSGYYNSLPRSGTNPGGMDDGGHVENFPAALDDVGAAAVEMIADNAATKAAILADNDATQAAIVADNDATQAAIEADNDATAAAVAGSAATAVAARDTAVGAKDTAVAKAAEASMSSATALREIVANFPDRLDATAYAFTEALTGDPSAVASAPGAKIVNAAGFGYVYQAAGAATLAHKGVITAGAEYVIEVAVEIEQTVVGAGETPAARIRLQGLDKDYASTGAAVTSPLVVTPVGVTVVTHRFAYVAPAGGTAWPQPGVALWLRPAVDINRKSDDSGAAAGSTARVRRLTVRDVTAVVAAELAAAAAAAAAAAVTFSNQPDAEAGLRADTVMSPLQTAQAIAYQALAVGAVIKAAATPGPRFLLCDGASYLKTTYPALAGILGDRHASYALTTPTLKAGYTFPAIYAEAGLAIAIGTNGNIQTSADGATWTERALSTANFNEGRGVIKLAAKYYAYGIGTGTGVRALVSSANGTTGWADVAAFAAFANGQAGISSMAYGTLAGVATVVAVGGSESGAYIQLRYSTDEGINWAHADPWSPGGYGSSAAKVLVANGVIALFFGAGNVFKRGASIAAIADVIGIPAVPSSVDIGNNLFVCIIGGKIYTSPDLLSFTYQEPPAPLTTSSFIYLGHFNGAHHFRASFDGFARCYATANFVNWQRVQLPAGIQEATSPLKPIAGKFITATGTEKALLASFTHNATTQFPVPWTPGDMPSYIKAY
jgi:hypothetical protein